MIDRHCLIAALLFLLSDIIACVAYFMTKNHEHFDYSQLRNLDPEYIQREWEWHIEHGRIESTYEVINAIAWFVFAIPGTFPFNVDDSLDFVFLLVTHVVAYSVIKVTWIQSCAGTRQMGLHLSIVVLALGGSFSELLSRLLSLGSANALGWMAGSFNLDDWNVTSTANDEIGWRTLQMIDIAINGLLLWIDAVEYLFLSGILILLFFSIRSTDGYKLFGMRWAYFGMFMACLGIVEFACAILRFENWITFSSLGFIINVLNQLFLFPIWLLWLSRQLPKAEAMASSRATVDENKITESSDSVLT
jgi:hypothetical protein